VDNVKHKRRFYLRIVSALLLVVIVVMLALWRPWQYKPGSNDRTVTVTGEATVKAEPDEYVFNPYYEFKNKDKDAALASLTKKSNSVIDGLKKLGVEDSKIKSNSNGYDYPVYLDQKETSTYTLSLTVTVSNREMAQKVQDYLTDTTPAGSISPQATFSESKRKELESQARDEATKDARAKADQSANNLGFRIGAVKSVEDGAGFGIGPVPLYEGRGIALDSAMEKSSLPVQPGENELTYTVTVVYFLR
jgi:uncharacterized protein YggE